jgi:hypothetical protein
VFVAAAAVAVAAAAVGEHEDLLGARPAVAAVSVPPAGEAVHSELGCVAAGADADTAAVVVRVVDAVGMATPSVSLGKSWSLTGRGACRQARPAWAKLPISSRCLVSIVCCGHN